MNISPQCRSILSGCVLALFATGPCALRVNASAQVVKPASTFSQVDTLGLPPDTASQLKLALQAHDYIAAEKTLLPAIQKAPHSRQAAQLLQFLGGVYLLNQDAWHAAIAWNKAKAIEPLPPTLDFSLAMAYIRLGRSDWARKTLESLAGNDGNNAIYPYWLGRLDYDAHHYDSAILRFQKAIQLAPEMAQAYNNLGLCYYRQNQNQLAAANYQKAIDLNLKAGHTDAWPYLNLAVAERALNQRSKAGAHLREAIRLDPNFALAHFQLGNILEDSGRTKEAIQQFKVAVSLDPGYAEPHFALARIYRRLGDTANSKREVEAYLRIHSRPNAQALASSVPAHP